MKKIFNEHGLLILSGLVLSIAIALIGPFSLKNGQNVGSAATKPNIVLVMADDLDLKSVQRMVSNGWMPNLKQHIIDRGITFSNSFVSNSLCCPSRATLLTGQYPHNHGVLTNAAPNGGVTALDDSNTLATWLQGAGYYTGHVGKYLNGYGMADLNGDQVVDLIDKTYIPPGWDDWQGLVDGSTYLMYGYTLNDHGTLIKYGEAPQDYQTDVLAKRSYDFIKEASTTGKAFFLEVMPLAPHIEMGPMATGTVWEWTVRPAPRHEEAFASLNMPLVPSFNEADMTDKPAFNRYAPLLTDTDKAALQNKYRNRLESLGAVDDMIGKIATALQEEGIYDNTVFIFTSDNGYMLGEHRLPEKFVAYEEAIRVPLYISIPGVVPKTIPQPVINNDLAPTLSELAGATPGLAVDGSSFVSLVNDPQTPWRKRFLVEHVQASSGDDYVTSYSAVRSFYEPLPAQLYVEYVDGSLELYDIKKDPYQLQSLHASSTWDTKRTTHDLWLEALKTCGLGTCHTIEFK